MCLKLRANVEAGEVGEVVAAEQKENANKGRNDEKKCDSREVLQLSHSGIATQQSAAARRRERRGIWRNSLVALHGGGCWLVVVVDNVERAGRSVVSRLVHDVESASCAAAGGAVRKIHGDVNAID